MTLTVAVRAPPRAGENVRYPVQYCPENNAEPEQPSAVIEKSAALVPPRATLVMVGLAFPVLVKLKLCGALVVPKSCVVANTRGDGRGEDARAVPTVFLIVIVPVRYPADAGANSTNAQQLPPVATVWPLQVSPPAGRMKFPVTAALPKVTLAASL